MWLSTANHSALFQHSIVMLLCYAGILLSDWLNLIMWLSTANHCALFQHGVVMLLKFVYDNQLLVRTFKKSAVVAAAAHLKEKVKMAIRWVGALGTEINPI